MMEDVWGGGALYWVSAIVQYDKTSKPRLCAKSNVQFSRETYKITI